MPIGLAVDGANRLDMKLTEATSQAVVIERPVPSPADPQHPFVYKRYDRPQVRDLLTRFGYRAHPRTHGEKKTARQDIPDHRARRWMVESTHRWINPF